MWQLNAFMQHDSVLAVGDSPKPTESRTTKHARAPAAKSRRGSRLKAGLGRGRTVSGQNSTTATLSGSMSTMHNAEAAQGTPKAAIFVIPRSIGLTWITSGLASSSRDIMQERQESYMHTLQEEVERLRRAHVDLQNQLQEHGEQLHAVVNAMGAPRE